MRQVRTEEIAGADDQRSDALLAGGCKPLLHFDADLAFSRQWMLRRIFAHDRTCVGAEIVDVSGKDDAGAA